MSLANKITYLLASLLVPVMLIGQTSSEKLKKEQELLEQRIKDTKTLLNKLQSDEEASLNELRLIEKQVEFREELVRNFDNQVRRADATISGKGQQIEMLEMRLTKLKQQYKALLLYAYKHRNKYGDLMYLISAKSYFEAIKRKKYLDKIAELQEKQYIVVKQNQRLIKNEIEEIKTVRDEKQALLNVKKKEKQSVLQSKNQQQRLFSKFKSEAENVRKRLRDEERAREKLKREIDEAIKREIAEAERKRKEEERKRRLAAANAAKANEAEKAFAAKEAREGMLIDQNFEANRGRLPWPVQTGTITEGYGRNPHPTLDNVFTNNNGIDVSTPKNAEVRAVFEGEVTSVLNIPGAGKVVILKHGNYRTVYSNLQESYVTVGMKISTKQAIGSLLLKPGQNVSVVHFEVHKVSGSSVQSLNPSSWIVP